MASFLSTFTGVALINTSSRAGTVTLPSTAEIPNRQIIFKDINGTFLTRPLTLSTRIGDTFEDGTTRKIFSDTFGYMSLYAASNKWYLLGGTTTTQGTISTMSMLSSSVSSLTASNIVATTLSSLLLNTSTLLTQTAYIGTVSTVNALQYYGLQGGFNNSVLAEVSTGAGTQELLMFKGSTTTDRIRLQTTGNFVIETGVSSRLWPTTTSNVTPSLIINTSSNVGIQTNNPTTTLDVNGTGRFTVVSSQSIVMSSLTGINVSSVVGTVSSLFVNSLQIGDGTGWVSMGPLQTVAASTLTLSISSINGLGGYPSAYVSQGRLSANQNATSGVDLVIPWISDFDPYGWLQNAGTSSARVIPTVPGYYMVSFQVWWGIGTGANQVNIQSRKNTATFAINQQPLNTANGMTQNQTKIVYMNGTTDYLDFTAFTGTSGATQTVQAGGGTTGQGSFYSVSLLR